MDRALLIRGLALLVPLMASWLVWRAGQVPPKRALGALLATLFLLPGLLALHVLAGRAGWWSYSAVGGLFVGFPVDLYLGWALLWGALPALALSRAPLVAVLLGLLWLDLVLMPNAEPVVQLGSGWIWGELIGLVALALPAQLLARWTENQARLKARVTMQAIAFGGLMLFVLPAVILEASGAFISSISFELAGVRGLGLQLLALPAVLALSAVQEFVERGRGTPLPYDPPCQLVVSGPYRYVANPMSLSMTLLLVGWGIWLGSFWVALAGGMGGVFAAGIARWSEEGDMARRFVDDWRDYRLAVRAWWPRWRPAESEAKDAVLYVAASCAACSQLWRWFERREPIGLTVRPAEEHPSGGLRRLTYEPGDGSERVQGLAALGRGLEHINLAYAWMGFTLRLPVIHPVLQLLTDAVGGGPRELAGDG